LLQENLHLSADSFLWGLSGMCELHRLPFSSALVLAHNPPPYTLESIREAAAALGLKTALRMAGPADLAALPLPCLVVLGVSRADVSHRPPQPGSFPVDVPVRDVGEAQLGPDGILRGVPWVPSPIRNPEGSIGPLEQSHGGADKPRAIRLAFVLRYDEPRVVLLQEGSEHPVIERSSVFAQQFAGESIVFSAEAGDDPLGKQKDARQGSTGFRRLVARLLGRHILPRDGLHQ